MSMQDFEYYLIDDNTGEYYELGPGNWNSAFNISSIAGKCTYNKLTLERFSQHVYGTLEVNEHIRNVWKDVKVWAADRVRGTRLVRKDLCEDQDVPIDSVYQKTGSRFYLVELQ